MKAFALLALVAASPAALADASLRSGIEAMNKPLVASMLRLDATAFANTVKAGVTKDFKFTDDGRPMSLDTMLANMKAGFGMYKKMTRASTKIVSVTEKGDAGRAVQIHTTEGTTVGPDKKPHTILFVGTSTETYRKVGGKWKMASMSMKTGKMTMDGKPMSMGG